MHLRYLLYWLLLSVVASSARLGAIDYSFIVLPPTPDMPTSTTVVAAALNNLGQVAGYELSQSNLRVPLIWTGGVPSKLDIPTGYRLTEMRSINDAGQVLGEAIEIATQASVGVRWTKGVPEIITAGSAACEGLLMTSVINMNAAGHVLGETEGGSCHLLWVFVDGAIQTFPTPATGALTLVGINDAGHILGYYFNQLKPYTPYEIYIIESGQPSIHYPFPPASGPQLSVPNNLDQFTGEAFQEGPTYNYLWTGPSTLVGLPPNNADSIFFSNVNDAGELVLSGGSTYSVQKGATMLGQINTSVSIYGNPILNDGGQFLASEALGGVINALFTPVFAAVPTNVTGQVRVLPGDVKFNPATGRFTQAVNLMNAGDTAIEGPTFLVLERLAPQISVYGLTGTTVHTQPGGEPYVRIPPSFGPAGVGVTLELQFLDVEQLPIQWTPLVFAVSESAGI
jgi:hypothetical protein